MLISSEFETFRLTLLNYPKIKNFTVVCVCIWELMLFSDFYFFSSYILVVLL